MDINNKNECVKFSKTIIGLWPDKGTELKHKNCFELLVSVILSAQCTDDQVNKVSPILFCNYPDALSMSQASITSIENLIKTCGFYHTKAAHILSTAQILVTKYNSVVPDSMEELLKLPGVGRKTANLVLSVWYKKPGIVVDTHVLRICSRLGIAKTTKAEKTEAVIAKTFPSIEWNDLSYALNRHGKFVCKARKALCSECKISEFCSNFRHQ